MFGNNQQLNLQKLEVRINSVCDVVQQQNITVGELTKRIGSLETDYSQFRNEINNRLRSLNNLLDEKLDIQKETTENLLIGLEKAFQAKINTLNKDGSIVTDLLKKIAYLEGITDAIEHRRSTEEVLGTIKVLDEKMLKDDREEKNTDILKEQIKILKWALGENI